MKIDYCCTYWGSEQLSPAQFFTRLLQAGYTGIEVNLGNDNNLATAFEREVEKQRKLAHFHFVPQLIATNKSLGVEQTISDLLQQLNRIAILQPDFVNSQTGRDYFSFDENCLIIDAIENFAAQKGLTILHETHRGSFAFHAPLLLRYLTRYPNIRLTADLSHFCVVSESMLQEQSESLRIIFAHVQHIHARIGHPQGPQVNDPFAPEWQEQLSTHLSWWQQMVQLNNALNKPGLTITPEFGPLPYMPSKPYTLEPLSNQWEINKQMMVYLQQHLAPSL